MERNLNLFRSELKQERSYSLAWLKERKLKACVACSFFPKKSVDFFKHVYASCLSYIMANSFKIFVALVKPKLTV